MLAIGVSVSALSFEEWKAQHGVTYSTPETEAYREAIWTTNMKKIDTFNANSNASYTLGMNVFGDMVGLRSLEKLRDLI